MSKLGVGGTGGILFAVRYGSGLDRLTQTFRSYWSFWDTPTNHASLLVLHREMKNTLKGDLETIYDGRKCKTLGTRLILLTEIQIRFWEEKREMNGHEITECDLDF